MIPVGVTGGIGAGKTTVLECFRTLGAETIDADHVVHRLYAPGQAGYQAVVNRWGCDILKADGNVDRGALARIVFADRAERTWLNEVIHPMVRERFLRAAARPGRQLLFCAVPLLFETGWTDLFNASLAVWCAAAIQRQRLANRGWTDEDIDRRLRAQMPMDDKLMRADYGIVNTGSLSMLRSQCECVVDRLRMRLLNLRLTSQPMLSEQ